MHVRYQPFRLRYWKDTASGKSLFNAITALNLSFGKGVNLETLITRFSSSSSSGLVAKWPVHRNIFVCVLFCNNKRSILIMRILIIYADWDDDVTTIPDKNNENFWKIAFSHLSKQQSPLLPDQCYGSRPSIRETHYPGNPYYNMLWFSAKYPGNPFYNIDLGGGGNYF